MRWAKHIIILAGFIWLISGFYLPGGEAMVGCLPGVTPEMLNAGYWTAKNPDAGRILMAPAAIRAFNEQIRQRLPGTVYDLTVYPEKLAKSDLVQLLGTYQFPDDQLYVAGVPAGTDYYNGLRQNMNLAAVQEQNQVRYAFTVTRTNVRTFPTAAGVFASPGDRDFDQFQETALDPAEPVLILHQSADGNWYFIQAGNYRGWVAAAGVAIAADRDVWQRYINEPDFLVVTDGLFRLNRRAADNSAALLFQMGAKIPLAEVGNGRYIVKLPGRDPAGNLYFFRTEVAPTAGIREGYLPYTRENIIRQAFKMLGQRYGWGGMFDSVDCSGFIMDIYRVFGFAYPRNADEQEQSAGQTVNLAGGDWARFSERMRNLSPGATLHMDGHVMLYLGEDNGDYYVIHSLAAHGDPNQPTTGGRLKRVADNAVVVSTLTLYRASGRQFWQSLTTGKNVR